MFITDPHYKKLKKKEKKRREEKMWLSYAIFFLREINKTLNCQKLMRKYQRVSKYLNFKYFSFFPIFLCTFTSHLKNFRFKLSYLLEMLNY